MKTKVGLQNEPYKKIGTKTEFRAETAKEMRSNAVPQKSVSNSEETAEVGIGHGEISPLSP